MAVVSATAATASVISVLYCIISHNIFLIGYFVYKISFSFGFSFFILFTLFTLYTLSTFLPFKMANANAINYLTLGNRNLHPQLVVGRIITSLHTLAFVVLYSFQLTGCVIDVVYYLSIRGIYL